MKRPRLESLQVRHRVGLLHLQDVALQQLPALALEMHDGPPLRVVHRGRAVAGPEEKDEAAEN